MRQRLWHLGKVLLCSALVGGICVSGAGAASSINRGDLSLDVDEYAVELAAGQNLSVPVYADPWTDKQLEGCGMPECPSICGEKDCLRESPYRPGVYDCICAGTDYRDYDTKLSVASSDTGVATASVSGQSVKITGRKEGEATITVTAQLREWTEATATIDVVVTAKEEDGQAEGGSGGGGSGGGGSKTTTVSLNAEGSVTLAPSVLTAAPEVKVTGPVKLVLDQNALQAIGTSKALTIKAQTVDNKTLTADFQRVVGNRPVVDIELKSGDQQVTSLGEGKLQVSLAYKPAVGEDTALLTVYCLTPEGQAEEMGGAVYDAKAKAVLFTTSHLSRFGVGLRTPAAAVSFQDVPRTSWAAAYIYYLVDKNVIGGVSDTHFAPEQNITRAEFVKLLAGAGGAEVSTVTSTAFADVPVSAWYAPYVVWASQNGVAQGNGDQFQPTAAISRQEMAVMLSRFAQAHNISLPQSTAAVAFSDQAHIASYAQKAVAQMQQAGVIGGKAGGAFAPNDAATRAEAAKMVAVFMQLMAK